MTWHLIKDTPESICIFIPSSSSRFIFILNMISSFSSFFFYPHHLSLSIDYWPIWGCRKGSDQTFPDWLRASRFFFELMSEWVWQNSEDFIPSTSTERSEVGDKLQNYLWTLWGPFFLFLFCPIFLPPLFLLVIDADNVGDREDEDLSDGRRLINTQRKEGKFKFKRTRHESKRLMTGGNVNKAEIIGGCTQSYAPHHTTTNHHLLVNQTWRA